MSPRRWILTCLLIALALCALSGVLVLGVDSETAVWQTLRMAGLTAVAAGLMLPLTLLTDRPKLRLCGFISMTLVVLLWLCGIGLVHAELSRSIRWEWERFIEASFWLTLLMAVPAAGVALLVSFPRARYAVLTFLPVTATSWLICECAALYDQFHMRRIYAGLGRSYSYEVPWASYLYETGFILLGMGACAAALLVNARCGDRRYFRIPGIIVAILATCCFITACWIPPLGFEDALARPLERLGLEGLIVALVLALINLVLMARVRQSQFWLIYATMTCAVVAGLAAVPLPYITSAYHPVLELLLRVVAGASIAAISGGIALLVLTMLNRKPAALLALGALTATELTLTCPRCQSRQTLPFGSSTCRNCQLQFSIQVHESRCPACGYLLYQLTSAQCPECGAPVEASASPTSPAVPVVNGPVTTSVP